MNGQSMEPTLHDGQIIFVEKQIQEIERGDIVVFMPRVDIARTHYIKRIIWLPWETIKFQSGAVFIKKIGDQDFSLLEESYLDTQSQNQTLLPLYSEYSEFTIPDKSYWLMWDNRHNSADSRLCFMSCYGKSENAHFIEKDQITGKVIP